MRDRELYAQILGIRSPWRVHDVALELDAGRVEVFVEPEPDAPMHCPHCQASASRYDKRRRRWRHLDTCQYQTVLVADLPRVSCPEHGVTQVQVPWAEPDSRFTALFEAMVIEWLAEASISAVARRMRLGWDAIDGIMGRAVARGMARRDTTSDYPDIDVDEVAFRKGREYLTVVSDPGTGAVIHLAEGRTKASLSEFYDTLSEEQLGAIGTVSMDMWGAFISATLEHVPGAHEKIGFDRFHVAQHLGRAVDEVRRADAAEATLPTQIPEEPLFSPSSASGTRGGKKIVAVDHARLPYPKATSRAARPRRMQRHVEDSIETLRWGLSWAIARTLPRCPCCCRRQIRQLS